MRSLLIQVFFVGLFFIVGCGNNDISADWEPSLPISPTELHAKQGDCFYFKDSTGNYFLATLMNFHKADDGIRYALCFANYYGTVLPNVTLVDSLKFYGRKVMYSTADEYKIGFDVVWLRDSTVDSNSKGIVKQIDVSEVASVDISAEGNASNFKEFSEAFHRSRFNRRLPPDHYSDLTKDNFRPDEYFTLQQITEWYKSFKGK